MILKGSSADCSPVDCSLTPITARDINGLAAYFPVLIVDHGAAAPVHCFRKLFSFRHNVTTTTRDSQNASALGIRVGRAAGKVQSYESSTIGLNIRLSGSESPFCGTFHYSTTTSETFTLMDCFTMTFNGPSTLCADDYYCDRRTLPTIGTDPDFTSTIPMTTAVTTAATNTAGLTVTVNPQSSHATTESTAPRPSNGLESEPQQPSTLPLGPIIGGVLGGLALISAVVLILVWMSYKRRKESRSIEVQPPEPDNEDRADHDGLEQLSGNPVKQELSGVSPAVVPSSLSPVSREPDPTAWKNGELETKHELPT